MKCPICGSDLKVDEKHGKVLMEHLVREPYGESYF